MLSLLGKYPTGVTNLYLQNILIFLLIAIYCFYIMKKLKKQGEDRKSKTAFQALVFMLLLVIVNLVVYFNNNL